MTSHLPHPSHLLPPLKVVFRVAAGPRVGFGHLVRCRSLARALAVTPLVSIRGTARTRDRAVAMGFTVIDSTWTPIKGGPTESSSPITAGPSFMGGRLPDLVVVDDPVQKSADAWVKQARRLGVPVASVHDLGLAHVASDLVIDGTIGAHGDLRGAQFAILDPSIAGIRKEGRHPAPGRVVIALGGGSHVLSLGGRLSAAIARRAPEAAIRVVRGFSSGRQPAALRHATWIDAPNGLGHELADAEVAVVAGGVTLYEACALGIPVVALPVTAAQHGTVRAAACRGAAIDTGRPPVDDCMVSRTADAVAALLQSPALRRRQSEAAKAMVDGEGATRVAARLRELVAVYPAKAGCHIPGNANAA
jgi:UDP-2,4-diacetamido-2,4,6-trideoxy-beta-L-altropyranose hydrolase